MCVCVCVCVFVCACVCVQVGVCARGGEGVKKKRENTKGRKHSKSCNQIVKKHRRSHAHMTGSK